MTEELLEQISHQLVGVSILQLIISLKMTVLLFMLYDWKQKWQRKN